MPDTTYIKVPRIGDTIVSEVTNKHYFIDDVISIDPDGPRAFVRCYRRGQDVEDSKTFYEAWIDIGDHFAGNEWRFSDENYKRHRNFIPEILPDRIAANDVITMLVQSVNQLRIEHNKKHCL